MVLGLESGLEGTKTCMCLCACAVLSSLPLAVGPGYSLLVRPQPIARGPKPSHRSWPRPCRAQIWGCERLKDLGVVTERKIHIMFSDCRLDAR